MNDPIERQDAINEAEQWIKIYSSGRGGQRERDAIKQVISGIKKLPSAQPEVKPIDYRDCANAMLKMWMDNVVTDGEYSRIMDKLNAYWRK